MCWSWSLGWAGLELSWSWAVAGAGAERCGRALRQSSNCRTRSAPLRLHHARSQQCAHTTRLHLQNAQKQKQKRIIPRHPKTSSEIPKVFPREPQRSSETHSTYPALKIRAAQHQSGSTLCVCLSLSPSLSVSLCGSSGREFQPPRGTCV